MIYHSIPSGLQNIAKNGVYHVIRQMISNLCVLAPLAHIQKKHRGTWFRNFNANELNVMHR